MSGSYRRVVFLLAVVLGAAPASAQVTGTTILTFDTGSSTGPVPQDYGDNVQSTTQGGYSYGGSGLMTPDITVDYYAYPLQTNHYLASYSSGYAGLTNVAYGPTTLTSVKIRFTAATGINVVLDSVDVASWQGMAITVPQINVLDISGNAAWTQSNLVLPASTTNHLNLVFSPPPISPVLELELILPASGMFYFAIDNLTFSQVGATTGNGQANSAAASLQINGQGTLGVQGPFLVSASVGGTLTFNWAGPPGGRILLFAGPQNVGGLFAPGFGSVDIGTPPTYSDIQVLVSGADPAFPGYMFNLDPSGIAQQSFTIPFPGGINMQAIIRDVSAGTLGLTAAFYVSML